MSLLLAADYSDDLCNRLDKIRLKFEEMELSDDQRDELLTELELSLEHARRIRQLIEGVLVPEDHGLAVTFLPPVVRSEGGKLLAEKSAGYGSSTQRRIGDKRGTLFLPFKREGEEEEDA